MNIRRLEYFVTLARSGSLQRAGELLGLSPPALSKAMSVLEDELGTKLWIRDGRRKILSEPGRRLLKRAPALVDELKSLREDLGEKPGVRPVRIGTFEVFSTYFLSFLEKQEWNNQSLELHELLPGEIERYLIQGELDVGISYMPVPDPRLDFIKAARIEMGVFTRKGAFKGLAQKDLPFVVPVMPLQGVPTRVRGLDGWPEDAYERRILHRVTLLESAMELCRQGLTAGYFPAFIAAEHNRRVRPDLALERRRSPYSGRVCSVDVFLVKRKSTEESPTIRKLARALRAIGTSAR